MYRTMPFQQWNVGPRAIPSYLHALAQQEHARRSLPYGLDIWAPKKVLSIQWDTGGRFEVISYRRKAVAIAVRNVSGRRRWSKLREWLNVGSDTPQPASVTRPR